MFYCILMLMDGGIGCEAGLDNSHVFKNVLAMSALFYYRSKDIELLYGYLTIENGAAL